ncbi:SRPBCC family protein [Streptomyces ipomoeae]|uniref:SRPBCC family protein n=1 Tax=Streptomyces ipomoeae TaxID=103232 RepID=UPI00114780F7|nr:SRPBCC family protein [Streptomyces ipomoeae]MDX2936764.1 SRPBCC family protein [Streptomyces ipomoeae]TQE18651.1 SRPBCC domain-containing protein [Streptomyces ipomoeae]
MTTQNAINWPEKYLPGTGDNFVSNEVIVKGITADRVWHYLTDTSTWESYYDNVAGISFPGGGGPVLKDDIAFSFGTFGFPPLDAHVVEFQDPAENVPGRLSWTAKQDGKPEQRLDVLHAWLVEDLPGGRVRILTQETQIGRPAAELARQTPNPMLNGHQAWLDGLARAASGDLGT